jgi:hypothetical protein
MLGALQRAPVVDPSGGTDDATKSCTDRKTLPVSVRVSKQVLT